MSTTPVVNVLMPTYNHERFVAQAIESVLAQKTDFTYKLIVGDDCSTDRTQSIVRSYAEKYPDKVEFLFAPKNVGPFHRNRVSVQLLNQFNAKYVGILEGDDYWTDPLKLQKQVDYLEAHPDCAACFHNAQIVSDNPTQPPNYCSPDQKEVSTLVDIVTICLFIPCTVLFRNKLWPKLPDVFFSVLNVDWVLFVMLAEHGYLGYLDEVMAAYRVHSAGIWSRLNRVQQLQAHIKTYKAIDKHLEYRYTEIIAGKLLFLRQELTQLARTCLDDYHPLMRKGHYSDALALLFQATRLAPAEVLRPRRVLAVLKNGFVGAFLRHDNG